MVVAIPASSNKLPHSCYNNSLTSPFVKSCVADSCSFKGPLFASSVGKVETRPPFILSRSKTSSVKETEKAVSIEPIFDNTIQLTALKKFCFHTSHIRNLTKIPNNYSANSPGLTPIGPPMWQAEADTELTLSDTSSGRIGVNHGELAL